MKIRHTVIILNITVSKLAILYTLGTIAIIRWTVLQYYERKNCKVKTYLANH